MTPKVRPKLGLVMMTLGVVLFAIVLLWPTPDSRLTERKIAEFEREADAARPGSP